MSASDHRTVVRARIALTAIFAMHGMLFASWTAHIPAIQHEVGANNGELGTALLGAPVRSVLAMILVGRLIPRFGSRAVTRVGLVGYGLTGLLAGLAGNLGELFAARGVWGAFQGGLDVAMNAHGTEVERVHGGTIMSTFHGFWSIGGLTGALIGAPAAIAGLGYAGYACTMVIVRLSAARIFARAAPSRVIPALAGIAAIGMIAGLASRNTALTIAGFAALGIGLATVVPTAFSAASRIPGGKPGQYIAQVSALGWVGFMCGPPIIGHLSELIGLPLTLGLVPLLAAAIAAMVFFGHLLPDRPGGADHAAGESAPAVHGAGEER